jgi:hypothetical protein
MESDEKVMTAILIAITILIGVIVVAVAGYEIYRHPAEAKQLGTATIKIKGTARFQGEIGTNYGETRTYEATAPFTVELPYTQADYVSVSINSPGTLKVEIWIDKRIVEEERGEDVLLFWEAPIR